jgi:hypothetical protein
MEMETQNNGPYHVIDSGTQSPAGYYPAMEIGGIKIDFLPGPRRLKTGRDASIFNSILHGSQLPVKKDTFLISGKPYSFHGRSKCTFTQPLNSKIHILRC